MATQGDTSSCDPSPAAAADGLDPMMVDDVPLADQPVVDPPVADVTAKATVSCDPAESTTEMDTTVNPAEFVTEVDDSADLTPVMVIKPDPDTPPAPSYGVITTVFHCRSDVTVHRPSPPPSSSSPAAPPALPAEGKQQTMSQLEGQGKGRVEQVLELVEVSETAGDGGEAPDVDGEAPDVDGGGAGFGVEADDAERTLHVLVSDDVAWMRPASEARRQSKTPAVSDVSATVASSTPTGAARRKATGVTPRRVVVESTTPAASTARRRGEKRPRRRSATAAAVAAKDREPSPTPSPAAAAAEAESQPLPFDCDACQTRFCDRLSLAAHCREHGDPSAEPCRRCGRLLAAPLDRARHERRHRVTRPARAETRGGARDKARDGTAPTRLLPQRRGRNPTRCGSCGERFRARELRAHFAPHPRTGYYPCARCGDAFAQSCQLELHHCAGVTTLRRRRRAAPTAPERQISEEVQEVQEERQTYGKEEGIKLTYADDARVDDDHADDYAEENDVDVDNPPTGVEERLANNKDERTKRQQSVEDISIDEDPEADADDGGLNHDDDDDHDHDYDGDENGDGGDGDTHSEDEDGGDSSGGGDGDGGDDGGSHDCTHCGRSFVSARNLARHARIHGSRVQFACEVCQRAYSRLDALVRHSVEAHEQTRQFQCPQCRWKFTQRRILEYHLQGHERGEGRGGSVGRGPGRRPRPFRCKTCKRSFITETQLDEHACRADRSAEPGYICDICGKTIKTKVWLSRHRLLHGDQRPAKCETCGQGFIDDKALAKHIKTHTDGRRFLCDTCGKGFALKVTLQIHARTHTGERPYACEACGKRFCTRTQLFHHSKIHSGEKPYVCSVCQRGFRQSHHLKTHMKIHADRPERHAREARNARALELSAGPGGIPVVPEIRPVHVATPVTSMPPGLIVRLAESQAGAPTVIDDSTCGSEG